MFFCNWFRSKPKFEVGQLALVTPPSALCLLPACSFMSIRRCRWSKQEWVYDGPIFNAQDNKLISRTFASYFSEDCLAPIPGFE